MGLPLPSCFRYLHFTTAAARKSKLKFPSRVVSGVSYPQLILLQLAKLKALSLRGELVSGFISKNFWLLIQLAFHQRKTF
jgi:hypothetical protein